MATEVFPLVAGSTEDILVQLFDDASGSEVLFDLTGCSSYSASAKNPATGTKVNFSTPVVYGAATNGTLKLSQATAIFSETGTYDLQINFTDGVSKARKYPSEGNQLKIKVSGAN